MKKAPFKTPEFIFLQLLGDEDCDEFEETWKAHYWKFGEIITWCEDQINSSDEVYVRGEMLLELFEYLLECEEWVTGWSFEGVNRYDYKYCPLCERAKESGHAGDCARDRIKAIYEKLKEYYAEGEEGDASED